MDTKKLRQKILDLAIHGKLVPQDPNDEPASVLLERICAEKEQLIKEGKIKKSRKTSSSSDTPHYEQVPFEVPEGWAWSRLGEIFTLQAGKNITAKAIYAKQDTDHCYPCYGGNGLRGYVGSYNREGRFPLIGRQGALCGNINEANGRFYATEHAVIVNTYCDTNIDWAINVLVYLNLNQYATSTAQPGLSVGTINEVVIPIPPLEEQQRISQNLNDWFCLIDQIEQGKSDLQTTIKQTKNKILDLAIHGKLVPQDPNDEPVIELLKRIHPNFTPCDNAHYPQLPYGWASLRVGDICQLKNGYAFKSGLYANHGVRIIRIANVQDGYIEDNSPQYYTPEAMKGLEGFLLSEGDLLMSLTGNVGRVGFITNAFLPAALNQRVACIRNNNLPINIEYLYYFFQSEEFMSDCKKSGKGVAQQNISTEWLKDYTLPIPPLHEQERIVAAIKGMYSYLDTIKESL